MKTFILTGIVLILLVLDLAALHDIFKDEPDLSAEYSMLALSGLALLALILWKSASRSGDAGTRR